jgi:8-oxo-dGTP pyrophosphatase MutT (NUDIX family)
VSRSIVPKDAATVMLVRDAGGTGRMEVLMLRRNARSTWVGGVHLFPGGAVDAEDGGEAIAPWCRGRDDNEASRLLGVAEGGRSFFVAAVRECFEEAGILLGLVDGSPLSLTDPTAAGRFAEHRRRLNAGLLSLADICAAEALSLDLGRLAYFSHWITPEGSPRRYDTRFFVGVVPEDQEALHDDTEVVDSIWIEPEEALNRCRAGELDLWLPTMKNLEGIGRFASTGELMAATASAVVSTILPRLTMDGEVARLVLPGQEGYEEATGLPPGVPFPDVAHTAQSQSSNSGG